MISADVPGALGGERVDRAVATLWGLSRREAADAVDSGRVLLDGRPVTARSARVAGGQCLEVELRERLAAAVEPDPGVGFAVVEADGWVVVVDKPAGLVVHPGAGNPAGTLVNGLVARFPEVAAVGDPARPGIVHRLDAGTSGLLVVARRPQAYESLVAQLAARTVDRLYLALVVGEVASDSGLVDAPVGRSPSDPTLQAVVTGGRPARTRYQVVDRREGTTLVECRLETGRTHQIRVHLAAIGHPVVGDKRYGGGGGLPAGRPAACALGRPFLHAHSLSLDHPETAERRTWTSGLPPDLAAALSR